MIKPTIDQITEAIWKVIEPFIAGPGAPVHVQGFLTQEQIANMGQDNALGGWCDLVAARLTELACHRVTYTVSRSHAHDHQLLPQTVKSLDVVLQLQGAMIWTYWPGSPMRPRRIDTTPGDLLIMPRDISRAEDTIDAAAYAVFALNEPA